VPEVRIDFLSFSKLETIMRKYLLYLLLSLILTPMTVYAVKQPCDTPIGCYEQAIRQYEDALSQLKLANDKVKALTTEAEKNAKSISDLNQQYQVRFEELKSQLAQQEQKLATKAEADAANSAVSKADAAQGTANTAVSKADAAQGTANTAVSKADAAQGTANTAVSKADAAQGTANTAVSKADAAQGTANTAVSKAETIRIDNCGKVEGKCGEDLDDHPLYYLDRVGFSCPNDRPILKTFGYTRCGDRALGLKIVATCCSLVK
jgi:hypothetical protein